MLAQKARIILLKRVRMSAKPTGKKIISRQAGELDQLGWKLPDSIIAGLMVAGLTDKYSTLVSEIKNTALDQWKSEWVKNRLLTYQIPDAKPTASVNFARGQKRKRGNDGEKKEKESSNYKFCHKPSHNEDDTNVSDFVTFADDYTRYSCTFCLKKKSDVLKAFKKYTRRMKRQFGWKLRRFRSDNT